MSTLFAFLVVGFVFAIPVLVIILLIKAIRKKPIKKTAWSIVGCFIGTIVSALIFAALDPQSNCEHEFSVTEKVAATCLTEGKTVQVCPKCNKEIEEVLPMLVHEWKEADCEKPKTCQLCGKTEGEKQGHSWREATCETPKTCSVCNLTEGDALSADKIHKWEEATCTAPKTCTICGAVEGTALAHTVGDWKVVDEGTSKEQGTRQQKCVVCESVIKTEKFDSQVKIVADIVKKAVTGHLGNADVEVIAGEEEESFIVTGAIYCKNSEQTVKDILVSISEALQKADISAECLFAIGDIKEGTDGECLAMASINMEGVWELSSMSVNFNTERNEWITSQFSAWDGSHTVLKNLIKDNMNDEKSFKHIETTYIDVATEEKRDQVNELLQNAGYSQRVDVGDLFVMTEFSGKNAFNATVKNTAFGIVDYSENTVMLIGVE